MITLKFFVRCMENLEKMTVKYIENNDRKINSLLHTYYFSDIVVQYLFNNDDEAKSPQTGIIQSMMGKNEELDI